MSSDISAIDKPVILVLDDDLIIRKIWTASLSKAGFNVYASGSVVEAEELLTGISPAVCIVDRNLPGGLSGEDFLQRGKCGDSVSFMVTASDFDDDYEAELLKLGFRYVLRKPVSVKKLITCVAEAVKLYRLRKKMYDLRQIAAELQEELASAMDNVKCAVNDAGHD
jgi:phosphoserine phosphatase RsbU/P